MASGIREPLTSSWGGRRGGEDGRDQVSPQLDERDSGIGNQDVIEKKVLFLSPKQNKMKKRIHTAPSYQSTLKPKQGIESLKTNSFQTREAWQVETGS